MKVKYYPEEDLMTLTLSDKPYDYAEKAGSFIMHYTNSDKEPVMMEILNASKFLRETVQALPLPMINNILHAA